MIALMLALLVDHASTTPDDAMMSMAPPAPVAVAMMYDPGEGTYTIYPDVLPPCDEEDGTATSGGADVSACAWDDGTGVPFIVIRP